MGFRWLGAIALIGIIAPIVGVASAIGAVIGAIAAAAKIVAYCLNYRWYYFINKGCH